MLATVAEQGPVTSRSFDRPDGPRPEAWSWYGGKPTKQALDHLWTTGKLSVYTRNGFERHFDLTERIEPARDAAGEVDIQGTMQRVTSVIEGWVREHPEQWLWLHRRWR